MSTCTLFMFSQFFLLHFHLFVLLSALLKEANASLLFYIFLLLSVPLDFRLQFEKDLLVFSMTILFMFSQFLLLHFHLFVLLSVQHKEAIASLLFYSFLLLSVPLGFTLEFEKYFLVFAMKIPGHIGFLDFKYCVSN